MERAGRWVGGCEVEEDVVGREVVAVVDAGDVMEVGMDKERGSIAAMLGQYGVIVSVLREERRRTCST